MSTKVRLGWIDIIKGICMVFVMLAHSGVPEIYGKIYSPVFLTAFFFVSGYTFNGNIQFKNFLIKKIRTLLVPLLFFGVINIIIAYITQNESISFRFSGLLLQKVGNDDFWFLSCLFTCLIIFYGIVKISKNKFSMIFLISAILLIIGCINCYTINIKTYWHLEIALMVLIWMSLGYSYKMFEYKFKDFENIKCLLIGIVFYVVLIYFYNYYADIHMNLYNNYLLFAIASVVGISTLVIGAKLLKNNKILEFIGRNSIIYYSVHNKFIKIIGIILNKLGIEFSQYINSILVVVLAGILIVPLVFIINKYLPFVLGKTVDKKHI